MSPEAIVGMAMGVTLVVALASGLWIAIALFVTAFVMLHFFLDSPAGLILATSVWGASANWSLTALPLFVLMGELLSRSSIAEQLFKALVPWTARIPGGLLHMNVLGAGAFASVCGSSTATTVTVGRIVLPELLSRGYNEKIALGSLAGAGTFGLLIPPSIMFIIYGFTAEVSITKLFLAGVLPGVLMFFLFSGYIAIRALLDPSIAPPSDTRVALAERLRLLVHLLPVGALIVIIMASMYQGWATATEAAAVGVVGALILIVASGNFSFAAFREALLAAVRTTCMIGFILAGAAYLTTATTFSGIPQAIASWIVAMDLNAYTLIAVLTVIYIFLGLFLEGVSMLVLTASFILPMVKAAGIDLIWFGVYIVIVTEMALITPPVALNLFIVQSLANRDAMYVARAVIPFFLLMVAAVAILLVFPQIALFLPQTM